MSDNHEHGHTHTHEHFHEHTHIDENGHEFTHTHVHGDGAHHHDHGHVHSPEHTKSVLNRMSRIIGHMESTKRMVEDGRDCSEVLIQLSAIESAVKSVSRVILKEHLSTCIVDAVKKDDYESLEELNRALRLRVAEINRRPFQRREGSRESVLLGQERACLRPLPPVPYEMVERKTVTVQYNYHVAFDHRYYSVPAMLVRREVEIVATASTVAVMCDGERVAQHMRSYAGIYGMMKKIGNSPYHICYICESMDKTVEVLRAQGYVKYDEPHAAVAFDYRDVCFMVNPYLGMVELLEVAG